jgi:N-acetylmuramoyl-L-alanine amidase
MINGMPSLSEYACFTSHTNTSFKKNFWSDEMKILNKPTATYEQCEAWLRKKTTNQLAIDNLPILWKAAVSNGIDPVVLIAQAMTETGFFKFGGIIDASYHNTCGLKTTKGGGDYAASAHMRFKSWEDGIQAHADHLGLYAGATNCPKYSPECASDQNTEFKGNGTTKDPRHFSSLYGKCTTVESLKGTWATDPKYDIKLKSMINEIHNTEVDKETASLNNKTNAKHAANFNLNDLKEGIKKAAVGPLFKKRK